LQVMSLKYGVFKACYAKCERIIHSTYMVSHSSMEALKGDGIQVDLPWW